jgi:hypothetical protein
MEGFHPSETAAEQQVQLHPTPRTGLIVPKLTK